MSKKHYHEGNSLSTRVGNFPAHKARRLEVQIKARQLSTAVVVKGLSKFIRGKVSSDPLCRISPAYKRKKRGS